MNEDPTFRKNSVNSSFCAFAGLTGNPVSLRVLRKRLLTSFLVALKFFAFASLDFCPSYVLGSRLGNSLSATGKSNSANGTMTKTEKGTKRPRSCTVRRSYNHSAQPHSLTMIAAMNLPDGLLFD